MAMGLIRLPIWEPKFWKPATVPTLCGEGATSAGRLRIAAPAKEWAALLTVSTIISTRLLSMNGAHPMQALRPSPATIGTFRAAPGDRRPPASGPIRFRRARWIRSR